MQIARSSASIPVLLPPTRPAPAAAEPAAPADRAGDGPAPARAVAAAQRSDPLQDPAIQRVIAQLAARDREVRAHEQAHVAAGGELITSGPTYSYQTGPDGRRYAVGGEVGIDTSPVPDDPEATLRKADRVRAAALAPVQPSPQDFRVAAQADRMAGQARLEIAQERALETYRSVAKADG
ncbi:MAG: hypothetical protein MEQ07_00765 [Aquimonas sp.]|nr:hypothetical protein [Aquimonas sp.]